MNGFLRTVCASALLLGGVFAGAEEPQTPFEKRLEEPGAQQSMLNVASLLMGAGHPDASEAARATLRQRYWAFHDDIELPSDQLRREEVAFEQSFDAVAKAASERSLRRLTVAGLDDVASPACARWYYLALDSRGPALFRVVILRSETGARLLRFDVVTDLDEVEATMDAIEFPASEKTIHCNWTPPEKPAPATAVTLAP